ncbi:MetQ/NlpA family ABC transporter substrate-binding protein [Deinococcus sp. UR1]|jgi:D-methionine transport system substrate-binding protein|uniref:MetQ/NlpA family ABC transporter substrate-binding protein n=1 Tax=Deinococcus sp. UR1 TaxID=1704277 RepID=UPI000C18997D|nr:MetQ/NlpA family ABC transporter substrate-binding protein [Deinococcus sp. UR1]PIG96454.1 methionine ABC transporter substrate-binding protein [Deinococcus sp. UR1]
MRTLLILSALLAATTATAGTLRVGASPVPHADILTFVKPMLAKQGVTLVIREFNDYVQPNLALADGSIDVNFFQHTPYLTAFQKDRPLGLVAGAAVHVEPMGLYSRRVKALRDLKTGATIALPNDPSNSGRALKLLERAGLIRLKAGAGTAATTLDITSNVKRLKFRELDAAQLPRVLADVDAAIINTNYALDAGLNPLGDALTLEGSSSPYANRLVVQPATLKNPDYLKLVAALRSPTTRTFILNTYKGAVVPAF